MSSDEERRAAFRSLPAVRFKPQQLKCAQRRVRQARSHRLAAWLTMFASMRGTLRRASQSHTSHRSVPPTRVQTKSPSEAFTSCMSEGLPTVHAIDCMQHGTGRIGSARLSRTCHSCSRVEVPQTASHRHRCPDGLLGSMAASRCRTQIWGNDGVLLRTGGRRCMMYDARCNFCVARCSGAGGILN